MRLEQALDAAGRRGERAGNDAASGVFDGNTSERTYREFLRMSEEGDPAIDDLVQEPDWLSGEQTGESLSELLGDLIEDNEDNEDRIVEGYENAAHDAFWGGLERVARFQVGDDDDEDDDEDDDDEDDDSDREEDGDDDE